MTVRISVTDNATPAIRNAVNVLTLRRAARVAGAAVRVDIRKHLAAKQRLPNKLNAPKTNWYQRARDRVVFVQDGDHAYISIDFPGFRMRLTGDPAVITPVNAKALAIPIHSAAYGRRPREFDDLIFVPVLRGRTIGFLSRQVGVGATKVWINLYRLVKFVRTKADPTLLPPEADMVASAVRAVQVAAQRLLS